MPADSVIFMLRKAANISIRRYLMLADGLQRRYGLQPVLFGIDDCDPREIERSAEDLRHYFGREAPAFPYFTLSEVSGRSAAEVPVPERETCPHPLLERFLKWRYEEAVQRVGGLFADMADFLLKHPPRLLIYDIPILWTGQVLIDACRQAGARVVNLEHAEGMGQLYAHFSDRADAYFAYGGMNRANLHRMGVPGDKVFLTGNLDSDLLTDLQGAERTPQTQRDQAILLLLKPVKVAEAESLNQQLIESVCGNFPQHRVMVRVHPSVLSLEAEMAVVRDSVARHANAGFVEAAEPLAVSLTRVGAAMSFPSYALIESVLMGCRTVCVTGIQGFVYDDWAGFGIPCVDKAEMASGLTPELMRQALPSPGQVRRLQDHYRYQGEGPVLPRMLDRLGKIGGLQQGRVAGRSG